MIYLDNAATTFPKPQSVIRAVTDSFKSYGANPGRSGYELSVKTGEQIYNCRKEAAEFFGAESAENVVFTSGCTASLNFVIKGILKSGDHVVVSDLEHNSVMRTLFKLSQKSGISFGTAHIFHGDTAKTVQEFEKEMRPNTRAVICTHASNVFGTVLPIRELGALCKKRGCFFVVDAAQTAGTIPINVREMNIDYLCAPCHKGLYGVMGLGLIIFGDEKNGQIETLLEGGTGSSSTSYLQPDFLPDRFESGTVNVPGIIGAGAGIKFVKEKGMKKIYEHELRLMQKLFDSLENTDSVILYTPRPEIGESAPLISFNIAGMSSEKIAHILDGCGISVRAGLHCSPSAHKSHGTEQIGTVRVCPSVFTTEKEIDYFIKCTDKIAKKTKL